MSQGSKSGGGSHHDLLWSVHGCVFYFRKFLLGCPEQLRLRSFGGFLGTLSEYDRIFASNNSKKKSPSQKSSRHRLPAPAGCPPEASHNSHTLLFDCAFVRNPL